MSAVVAQRASAEIGRSLERLSDHDLAVSDRSEVTGRLYVDLADLQLAVAAMEAAVTEPGHAVPDAATPDCEDRLLRVAQGRWRRQGWGRRP
jgi:hypothetical protein